ncbi:MAG: helix-turn-helix domain-containing protein [Cyanobacteriota bacterium]
MPRFSGPAPCLPLQDEGFVTLLDTEDFDCWQAAVGSTLGHHRSELLSPKRPFQAHFRRADIGGYTVVHLRGRGRLRMVRHQPQGSVLWLPLRGIMRECVNGVPWVAEPGTGLLFHSGDAMVGDTSQELEGLSILIPEGLHRRPAGPCTPLLSEGPLQQRILTCARWMVHAAVERTPGGDHAADALTDALRAWTLWWEQPPNRERITARRRRAMVQLAREWMATRLQDRFSVLDLSEAMEVSPRQLHYSFLQELGHSPMAEAKRLRLRRLQSLLLDPDQNPRGIAALMVASGLAASGMTSADYRHWSGESPRQTRQRQPCPIP